MHSVVQVISYFRYLWIIFPLTMIYLVTRPENWWDSFKAMRCAQVVGTLCGIPGFMLVSLCVAGLVLSFSHSSTVSLAVLFALFGFVPGAILITLGALIYKMKKMALPVVATLVGLGLLRSLYIIVHPSGLHFMPAMWATMAAALIGQILLVEYLRRMRQWGYFR
jgi:hypothetical protein